MSRMVVVVDLDGTLYDSSERQHLAQNGEWDAFHEASYRDPPNEAVLDFLSVLPPAIKVVGCTGRNERYRGITERWMLKNSVPMDALLMRPDRDYTSDAAIKPFMLANWAKTHFPGQELKDVVWVVLEDRDKMVECWRGMGIPCWQVNPGVF